MFPEKQKPDHVQQCIVYAPEELAMGDVALGYGQAALRSAYSSFSVCHLSAVWDYNIREQQIWLQLHTQTEQKTERQTWKTK